MELSLRLDTLGMVEVRYLRARERFRDWPPFLLFAASRQARVLAYLTRETLEQLHTQILAVEEAAGLGIDDDDDADDDDNDNDADDARESEILNEGELEDNTQLSPAFAQALERLNDLARQRLPEVGSSAHPTSEELVDDGLALGDEDDALEQLQDALVQMMEVVRELAEELSTDALKLTGRLRCVRTDIFFTQAEREAGEDADDLVEDDDEDEENNLLDLALILRLFEDGRAKTDDLPVVELQLDVDDFERLHETLDIALERERRSRRRRG
ncbi:MAG TPA: hypothetical protein VKR83_20040 [Ktedonobacteraceae bacterium]|nr:hypothetical protein [Ktedonobacteraceae bacterium]